MSLNDEEVGKKRSSKKKSSIQSFSKKKRAQGPVKFKKASFRSMPSTFSELEGKILSCLSEGPLAASKLAQKFSRNSYSSAAIFQALQLLEKKRLLIRTHKDLCTLSKNTDFIVGILQVHANGSAHLLREEGADLFISPENLATGMHGDQVLARLFKQHPARRPSRTPRERRAEGEILHVLNRANKTIVGTLHGSSAAFYVIPDNPHLQHHLVLSGDLLGGKVGEKVVASLDRWDNQDTPPEGHLLEVLGPITAPGVDILSIIRKHQLPAAFPQEVLAEAAQFSGALRKEDFKDREDLRDRFVITIDPDDARDFDDAIEVQRSPSGWDVFIHIADVAHYVRPRSALDQEAYHRGNSVYLVDRVIPMLPENLSNGLCSLRPHEDRLAFSVFAHVSRSGVIKNVRFTRSVIRSKARLTYQEALQILATPPSNQLEERVHAAWECSSLLRHLRFQQGSLELDMPEVKVRLDQQGNVQRLELVENDISHQLIEELMLLANELVARHLKLAKQPLLYRVHEKPDHEKLTAFRELVSTYQVPAGDLNHRRELQKFLHALQGKPYEHALKIGLLKSLKRARYSPDPLGHYGLQKKDYAHFTSPIRRYADLIVHRALARQLDPHLPGPSSKNLLPIGNHISTTERTAADAEKESVRLKKLDYLEAEQHARKKHAWKANIVEARNYGLLVELPELLLSGLVPVASMDDDFYFFDALQARLIGQKNKRIYRAGQQIIVAVTHVDRWKQQVDFRLLSSKKLHSLDKNN